MFNNAIYIQRVFYRKIPLRVRGTIRNSKFDLKNETIRQLNILHFIPSIQMGITKQMIG